VAKPKKGTQPVVVLGFKGFDKNLACRGYQFEVGKTYEHDGKVEACQSGFHACEYPLHVLRYYAPGTSRFAVVEQAGALSRHDDDSKIASSRITVQAEIGLPGLIKAAIEYTTSRAKPVKGSVTKAANAAATASGEYGAATASGWSGAATASGRYGAATADHATAAAMASGYNGKARGKAGSMIALAERNASLNIISVGAGIVGRDGIKEDTWYSLKGGKPVEASP
jgi:hypothetical protein